MPLTSRIKIKRLYIIAPLDVKSHRLVHIFIKIHRVLHKTLEIQCCPIGRVFESDNGSYRDGPPSIRRGATPREKGHMHNIG